MAIQLAKEREVLIKVVEGVVAEDVTETRIRMLSTVTVCIGLK